MHLLVIVAAVIGGWPSRAWWPPPRSVPAAGGRCGLSGCREGDSPAMAERIRSVEGYADTADAE